MKGVFQEVILVAVVVTSSLIVINLITPTLETSTAFQNFEKAKEMMKVLDTVVQELLAEGKGSIRSVQIASDFGTFAVSGKDDRILFDMFTDVQVLEPGTSVTEGNLVITGGTAMKAYDGDIDSDGNIDIILENEAMKFGIRKLGSVDSWQPVNTSNIISKIESKLVNVNVTPVTKIMIGGSHPSSYGNGYSVVSQYGNSLGSSSVIVFVNASSGHRYNAIFTLRSTSDFVEIQVKRVI